MTGQATIERRGLLMEVRAAGRRLKGYAATFGTEARIADFTEVILPGAFRGSLMPSRDVLALVDHDPSKVLARTRSGSLRLAEDPRGLSFSLDVPDTQAGRDVLALAERGDLGGMSFGFTVAKDVLSREALSLARECGDWSDRESEQRFQAIFKRSMDAAKGKVVDWDGKKIDPRYRFKSDTIVDWLSITSTEMQDCGLRVLIDDDRRRDLATERKTAERRRKGVKERSEWKADKAQSRIDLGMKALLMRHREAMAVPEIAADLGVSERTAQTAMKIASERLNVKETAASA